MEEYLETPLEVLERLTPTLSDISTAVKSINAVGGISVESGEGTSLLWGIYNEEELAIAKGFMSAGTTFPEHRHENINEYGIIISGSVIVTMGGEKITLMAGDIIRVLPNKNHSIVAEVDTWYLAITIPADWGMPDVGK